MSIGAAKERRDSMRARVLEIQIELADGKAAYLIDKRSADLPKKCRLESELARLRYDINKLDQWIHANRKAEEAMRDASLLMTLLTLLSAQGMGEIVRLAQRQAQDATQAAARMVKPQGVEND